MGEIPSDAWHRYRCDVCGMEIEVAEKPVFIDHPKEYHESEQRGRFVYDVKSAKEHKQEDA